MNKFCKYVEIVGVLFFLFSGEIRAQEKVYKISKKESCKTGYMKSTFKLDNTARQNGIKFSNGGSEIYYCIVTKKNANGSEVTVGGYAYPDSEALEYTKNLAKKEIMYANQSLIFQYFMVDTSSQNREERSFVSHFEKNKNVEKVECTSGKCELKDSSQKCSKGYAKVTFKAYLDYSGLANVPSVYGKFQDGKQEKTYCVKKGSKLPNPGAATIEGKTYDKWQCISKVYNPEHKIGDVIQSTDDINCKFVYQEVREEVYEKEESKNLWDNLFKGSQATNKCGNVLSDRALKLLVQVYKTITQLAVAVVIILGMLDFFKATSVDDADAMKKVWQKFIKRLVAVILLVILPFILEFILSVFGDESMKTCLDQFH